MTGDDDDNNDDETIDDYPLPLFAIDRGQCRGPRHSVDRQRPARLCHDLAHLFHHGRPLLQGYLRPMRR